MRVRGRPLRNRSNEWSEQHKALLYWCAEKILKKIGPDGFEIDELVAVGWLRALRYNKGDRLFGATTNLLSKMWGYVNETRRKRHIFCATDDSFFKEGDLSAPIVRHFNSKELNPYESCSNKEVSLDFVIDLIGGILSSNQCSVCKRFLTEADFYWRFGRNGKRRKVSPMCKKCHTNSLNATKA